MARGAAKGGRKSGKTVKDTKNGKAADDYQVDIGGEGHNSAFVPSGKSLADFKQVVMDEELEIKAIMDAARLKCEGPRAAIKNAKKLMIEDGYHAQELNTLIRGWKLEYKLDHLADNLDADQREHFNSLDKALGDFLDTDLGRAAQVREAVTA